MIKRLSTMLLTMALMFSSCASYDVKKRSAAEVSSAGISAPLGYELVVFDSDGDAVKDDVAVLSCLGISGGYGSFRLEIYASDTTYYRKVFDSEQYTLDEATYEKLSENINGVLMLDTFYSVDAVDSDHDGCEELVCRQYAWVECHADHIGDVISTIKITDNGFEIIDVRFEPE